MRHPFNMSCLALAAVAMTACGAPEHVADPSGAELTREAAAARATLATMTARNPTGAAGEALDRAQQRLAEAEAHLADGDEEEATVWLESARSEIALVRSIGMRERAERRLERVQARYQQAQQTLQELQGKASAGSQP